MELIIEQSGANKCKESDFDVQKSLAPPKSVENLTSQRSLYSKAQMIWMLQMSIILVLFHNTLFSENADEFVAPSTTLFFMMVMTAYLFHIEAMVDAKDAYHKIQFLKRYPNYPSPQKR